MTLRPMANDAAQDDEAIARQLVALLGRRGEGAGVGRARRALDISSSTSSGGPV